LGSNFYMGKDLQQWFLRYSFVSSQCLWLWNDCSFFFFMLTRSWRRRRMNYRSITIETWARRTKWIAQMIWQW
jgi:hypothetical protein